MKLSDMGRAAVLKLAIERESLTVNESTARHMMRLQLARRTRPSHRTITLTWQGRKLAKRLAKRAMKLRLQGGIDAN